MPNWIHAGCSVTGTGHLRDGKPCEDDHRVFEVGGVLVLIGVDGCGSASNAQRGAAIAVSALHEYIGRWLSDEDNGKRIVDLKRSSSGLELEIIESMEAAFSLLEADIEDEASRVKTKATDYSVCASMVLVATHWYASAGLGDVACFNGSGNQWKITNTVTKWGVPKNPAARNATMLFPRQGQNSMPRPAVIDRKRGDLAMVCTDGALRKFANDTTPGSSRGIYVPRTSALREFQARVVERAHNSSDLDDRLLQYIDEIALAEVDDITIVCGMEAPK